MRRFKNILCVFDGEIGANAAFERARQLARQNDAKLTIMHSIDGAPEGSTSDADPRITEIWSAAEEDWRHQLELLSEAARRDDIELRIEVRTGRPFLEIIQEVLANRHDLVIKSAQSISATKELLFGGTDMHLMRKCPCPVWIEKETSPTSHRRILAAVDIAPGGSEKPLLNKMIMDLATSLADMEGARLDVVYAWFLPGEARLRSKAVIRPAYERLDMLLREERLACKTAFQSLIELYRTHPAIIEDNFINGDPSSVIPAFATTHAVDLIVMGTVGRSGIAGFFMGNTAEHVLRQVNCAVLTVKPSDFESPVHLRH